ncbi:MAG: helix-turn-helix domain-containing protein [Verrucomicrobiales bacterium]|nr:helix-turn-helix domain-containing protein [Verrucomicrobiales bacterium]
MNTTSSSPITLSEQLITGKEVCRILGISPRALHDYRTRRLIPYVKFSKRCIRYDVTAVKKAIERLSVPSID